MELTVDDGADITIQIPPNDFGIYDIMSLNGCLMYTGPIVDDQANDFNYYCGNVYLKNVIGEDGKAITIFLTNWCLTPRPTERCFLKILVI